MNTIIGASLTTRTDGLGTARYSDPVSGGTGGGFQGPQGWQGWLGDAGPQGDQGYQGPSGGGGGELDGTPPVVVSQDGIPGIADKGLRYDTRPGLFLVGNPPNADKRDYATLEFTNGTPGPQGLQVRVHAPLSVVPEGVGLDLGQGLEVPGGGPFVDKLSALVKPLAGINLDGDGLWARVDDDTVKIDGFGQLTAPGAVTLGTSPVIDSQAGTPGTADEGLKYDTKPGLLLVGNPAPLVTDEPMLQTPILVFLKTATGAVPKGLCLPLHGGLKPGPSEGVEVYTGKGIWVAQDIPGESWGRTSLLRGEDAPIPFSSGLEFDGDAVKVKVKPTSGIILDTDGLSVKLETNGGILFNLAGELYTVWQPDPV